MRVLVMRLGTAMTPLAHSNVGHGDEMLAMLRHLNSSHEVLAIGRFGVDPGVPHYQQQFTTSFPNENVNRMLEEYEECVRRAEEFDPHAIVTVIGPSGSVCIPGGRARTQAFCANYCGPVVSVWNAMPEVPRICILNDPRNIIRLSELKVWPDAVLTQCNADIPYRVFDTHMIRHYRYHKTQNWGLGSFDPGEGPRSGIGILAHSHIDDFRVGRRRDEVWDWILARCPGAKLRGRGWPDGPLPAGEVHEWLQGFEWGPMIPIAEGWVTAKFGQYTRAGCIPRPYDAGGLLTYDRDGLMIPKDHPIRWSGDNEYDPAWIHEALAWTQPDFSSLDNVLRDADRLPLYEEYGGYERI